MPPSSTAPATIRMPRVASSFLAMAPAATRATVSRPEERPEDLGQIAVIAGALVLVGDVESDGRAGGQALEHAGKDADGIGFLAFGGRGALSGLAQVQLALQVFLAQGQACGAAVQHAAQTGPMGFAVRGEAQDAPKGIACHITPPCCGP